MTLMPAVLHCLSEALNRRCRKTVVASLVMCLVLLSSASAQPPVQRVGETVADRSSTHYRIERFPVSSSDGSRKWRITVAIPKAMPPAAGYRSFWMLDGNAALMEFEDQWLETLATQSDPPVLIFISHDSDLRIEPEARYRDYTPALLPKGEGRDQELTGGADAFLEIIERRIRPQVQRLAPIDLERQTIWGHSLGGLFVLHTLFHRTGAFQAYVAASPSMWWGQGHAVAAVDRFVEHNAGHPASVVIHLGESERLGERRPRATLDARAAARLEQMKAAPPDAALTLAKRLKSVPGLDVTYQEFPGLGHGPMLRASLMAALNIASTTEPSHSQPTSTPTPKP